MRNYCELCRVKGSLAFPDDPESAALEQRGEITMCMSCAEMFDDLAFVEDNEQLERLTTSQIRAIVAHLRGTCGWAQPEGDDEEFEVTMDGGPPDERDVRALRESFTEPDEEQSSD